VSRVRENRTPVSMGELEKEPLGHLASSLPAHPRNRADYAILPLNPFILTNPSEYDCELS
jgi:hypothetical protein